MAENCSGEPECGCVTDGPCMDCGRPCPVWSADNALWNETVGGSAGLLCPTCFMYRAERPKRIFDVTLRNSACPCHNIYDCTEPPCSADCGPTSCAYGEHAA